MKKISVVILTVLIFAFVTAAAGQTPREEKDAVVKAALDYIEGWFEGNVERMDRALHPQLAKRVLRINPQTGEETLNDLKKEQMLEYTKQGGGKQVPADTRAIEVKVLDIYRGIATVRVDSVSFIDYLHLAKTKDGWKILNVLWAPNIKERRVAEVDPKIYEDFVGEYELQPEFIITVTADGGKLFIQATGQPVIEVFPESETKYFLKVTEAQISFVRDDSGAVSQLILHQGGRDIPAKKK